MMSKKRAKPEELADWDEKIEILAEEKVAILVFSIMLILTLRLDFAVVSMIMFFAILKILKYLAYLGSKAYHRNI